MDKQIYQQIMDKGTTIAEAKARLKELALKGATCPCCNQNVRIYQRPLTWAMAVGLIYLNRLAPDKYVHLEEFFRECRELPVSVRGDIPKLRFWGFIERKEGEREDGNPNNGYYRITKAGKIFVHLNMVAPSHIYIYNNKCLGAGAKSKMINISEALKNKFDYVKLMNGDL